MLPCLLFTNYMGAVFAKNVGEMDFQVFSYKKWTLTSHAQRLERHTSDFTCVYCTAVGTIFGTTDVYELSFSYLSINIFNAMFSANHIILT